MVEDYYSQNFWWKVCKANTSGGRVVQPTLMVEGMYSSNTSGGMSVQQTNQNFANCDIVWQKFLQLLREDKQYNFPSLTIC